MRIPRTWAYIISLTGGAIGAYQGYKLQRFLILENILRSPLKWQMIIVIGFFVASAFMTYMFLVANFGEPLIDRPLTKGEVRKAIEQRKSLAEEKKIVEIIKDIVVRFGEKGSYTQQDLSCVVNRERVLVRVPDKASGGWRTVFDAKFIPGDSLSFERLVLVPDEEGLEVKRRFSTIKSPDRYEIETYILGRWEDKLQYLSIHGKGRNKRPNAAQRKALKEYRRESERSERERLEEERRKFNV